MEVGVRIFVPSIQFTGTERTLIRDNIYYSSIGLLPNSEGLSNSISKKVDADGFWKYSKDKHPANKKILFLGDSVTMGIGVESDSTFAGRINNENDSLLVLNPSIIGYNNIDYLNVINFLIIENQNYIDVDAVYIFWCLNDVYDNSFADIGFNSNGIQDKIISFMRKHSKLFYFLKANFTDRAKAYFLHDARFYSSSDVSFQTAKNNLLKIHSTLTKKGINFKVVILPYEYQLRDKSFSVFQPNSIFTSFLSDKGIPYLDIGSKLRSESFDSNKLYLYGDGIHFSNFGHKVIADEIK